MSESRDAGGDSTPEGTPTGTPGPRRPATAPKYQRSPGGLTGALIVTVLAVLAFVAFRGLVRDNDPTPVRTIEYAKVVERARADGQLLVMAPPELPAGWTATSATYSPGAAATWHLGLLTEEGRYVGVEEARTSAADLVREHVDLDAERGEDVAIGGQTWQSWSDAGGDYALTRSLVLDGRSVSTWLVVGTAPESVIRDFAESLDGRPVKVVD